MYISLSIALALSKGKGINMKSMHVVEAEAEAFLCLFRHACWIFAQKLLQNLIQNEQSLTPCVGAWKKSRKALVCVSDM